jgi:hypothetical protein
MRRARSLVANPHVKRAALAQSGMIPIDRSEIVTGPIALCDTLGPMTPTPKLDVRFRDLKREYFALKKAIEAKVTRWEFAAGDRYDPRPLWYERQKTKPGKVLEEDGSKATHHYGFDAQGNLVLTRQRAADGPPDQFTETFHVKKGDAVEMSQYASDPKDKAPLAFARYEMRKEAKDVVVHAFEQRTPAHCYREHYHYADGRLVRVDVEQGDVRAGKAAEPEPFQRLECEFDEAGRLAKLRSRWLPRIGSPERIEIVYEAKPEKITVKALADNVAGLLVSRVVDVVKGLALKDAAYCIALVYAPSVAAVPRVGIGLDRERNKWLRDKKTKVKDLAWTATGFKHFDTPELRLATPPLTGAFERLSEELEGNFTPFKKMLNEVAKRLAARDWLGELTVTDDFVAFATDVERADFKANFKVVVSSDRMATLKDKGLV